MRKYVQIGRRRFLASLVLAPSLIPSVTLSAAHSKSPSSPFNEYHTAEQVTAGLDLTGKVGLITGANSGIGHETLRVLVLRGARVYALARNIEKARAACDRVNVSDARGEAIPFACDQADLRSVSDCAESVNSLKTAIDFVICNAGVNLQSLEKINGIEKDFVVNHLGHFLLVNKIIELVKRAHQGRVVVVGSGIYPLAKRGLELDNLSGEKDYDFLRMYARSKLANIIFSKELARRLNGTRVTSNSLSPGFVDTQMNRKINGLFTEDALKDMISVERGAATSCYLASWPELSHATGYYFESCQIRPFPKIAISPRIGKQLWDISETLVSPYL